MIMDTATIIIFAIRASIKIGEAGYKSYVDITRNRELVLPLPDLPTEMTNTKAWLFFYKNDDCEGAQFVKQKKGSTTKPWSRVAELKKPLENFSLTEKEELKTLAARAKAQLGYWNGEECGVSDTISVGALYAVEGWEQGYSASSSIQRVAGAIVEVGIDFLQLNPQLFNTNTSEGKLIHSFINELDQINFSTEVLDNLPVQLFTATLETVSANSGVFGNNKNVHILIGNSATKVSELVTKRNKEINQNYTDETTRRNKRLEMEEWGELIFRGILDATARTAISDPGSFLGIQGKASQEMAQKIGGDVLDLMIGNESIEFKPIFSQAGAERLTRTALSVISKHPKLITNTDDKINKLFSEITGGLAGTNMPLFNDGMLPEIASIILEKTGDNLDLLWPNEQRSPQENILFIATQATIKALTDSNPDYPYWRPDFTHAEMLIVVETICDEIKTNPEWITGENKYFKSALNLALGQTITCLKAQKASLSAKTSANIITEVIKGIALRQELLEYYDEDGKIIAAAAIDAIISSIFNSSDKTIKWRICRDEILQKVINILMTELTESKASPKAVKALEKVMTNFMKDIKMKNKVDFVELKKIAKTQLQALP